MSGSTLAGYERMNPDLLASVGEVDMPDKPNDQLELLLSPDSWPQSDAMRAVLSDANLSQNGVAYTVNSGAFHAVYSHAVKIEINSGKPERLLTWIQGVGKAFDFLNPSPWNRTTEMVIHRSACRAYAADWALFSIDMDVTFGRLDPPARLRATDEAA